MTLMIGVFVFGCFVAITVGFGLLFAASALEVDSRDRFEGTGLAPDGEGESRV